MKSSSKILVALAAGAAAGLVAGLLFAPEKGAETRKNIRRQTGKLVDSLNGSLAEGKEQLSKLREELEAELDGIKEKMKNFV